MKLLEINSEGELVISDECRAIEPFASMFNLTYNKQKGDSDGRLRKRALQELKYVYFMYDWGSSHQTLDEASRHQEALASAGLPGNYKFSDELKQACEKFKKLRYTRPVRQLITARQSMDRVRNFLDNVDPGETIETVHPETGEVNHHPRYDTKEALDIAKMIQDHVKSLPDLIKKMNDLEAQVMKEESEQTTSRGEHEIGRLG
jgi:hypothetical protein